MNGQEEKDGWINTYRVRWFIPIADRNSKILQQLWVPAGTPYGAELYNGEWREVPTHIEGVTPCV